MKDDAPQHSTRAKVCLAFLIILIIVLAFVLPGIDPSSDHGHVPLLPN